MTSRPLLRDFLCRLTSLISQGNRRLRLPSRKKLEKSETVNTATNRLRETMQDDAEVVLWLAPIVVRLLGVTVMLPTGRVMTGRMLPTNFSNTDSATVTHEITRTAIDWFSSMKGSLTVAWLATDGGYQPQTTNIYSNVGTAAARLNHEKLVLYPVSWEVLLVYQVTVSSE